MARMCELGQTNEAGSHLIYAVPNDPTAVSLFKSGGVEAGRTDLIFPGGHDTGPVPRKPKQTETEDAIQCVAGR